MNDLSPLAWIPFVMVLTPVLVYTCTKVAVYAFFRARQQFNQNYPPNMKETSDEFKTGT